MMRSCDPCRSAGRAQWTRGIDGEVPKSSRWRGPTACPFRFKKSPMSTLTVRDWPGRTVSAPGTDAISVPLFKTMGTLNVEPAATVHQAELGQGSLCRRPARWAREGLFRTGRTTLVSRSRAQLCQRQLERPPARFGLESCLRWAGLSLPGGERGDGGRRIRGAIRAWAFAGNVAQTNRRATPYRWCADWPAPAPVCARCAVPGGRRSRRPEW